MVPDPTAPAPLTESPSPPARAAGRSRRSGDARRLQILWVEDDATRDDAGRALLTARAAPGELAPAVIPASSAAGALAELRRGAFDVVLLDLDLPDSRGLATLATVRPHLGHAAVVVLAADGDEETGLAALQMGATDYLLRHSLDPLHLRRALLFAQERRAAPGERRALRYLQVTLDSLQSHIAVLDRTGRIVLVNAAWRSFAGQNGYAHADAGIGTSYLDLCDAAAGREEPMAREVSRAIRDVMAGRRDAWAGEYTCHSPGEQRFFSVRVTPCSDPTLAVVIHHENITARRQLEDALRASNERFALVQLATGDVTWDWEMGRRPEAASRDLAAWESRVHPADRQRVRAGLDEALRDGTTWTAEYRYLMDERSYVAVYDRRTLLRDGQGHPERLIGSMQDVSERSRLTAALEQSEHHYRRLVERAPHMIYALDRAGRFTELNPAGAGILQRATAELLGRRFEAVIVPDDHRPAGRTFRSILTGLATTLEGRVRVRRPSGEERWLLIDAAPILDGATVVGAHGIARDITDERERDTRMRLFAAALENLTECVNVLDGEGRIVYANAAHARMLGYDPAAPPAAGMQAFAPDAAAADEFRAVQLHVRDGRAWRGRLNMRRGDGGVIPVETHMERVEQDGRSLIFAICRDVSAELEHEHRLRRAERLASMGTLLGGVAHELNNPLAAVVGFTQLLLIDDRPDGERDDLETIQREAQRMAAIIADLRRLSRDSHEAAAPLAPVDLNDVARHVLRTRAYALRTGNVEVREELEACLPPVLGDRGQLEQVVLNVVVNAEHAMRTNADGGVLVVRTRISSRGVTLEVGDTGCGIAPEQLGHIFDPFFTTKPVGEGTGLGLSLVHSIVSEHGGQIHAESTVGVGTTLRIDFRAALPAELLVPPPGPGASAIGLPARVLRILVVDDEDPVRHVVARYLTRRGHRVDEATDGSQALALLDRPGHADAPYDVILSDLRMPGLGGAELLARLRQRGDGTERRLIFLTGDTAPLPGNAETDTGGIPVLSKPIDLVALGRIVEQAAG